MDVRRWLEVEKPLGEASEVRGDVVIRNCDLLDGIVHDIGSGVDRVPKNRKAFSETFCISHSVTDRLAYGSPFGYCVDREAEKGT